MKRHEVPQDANSALRGERKAVYALDEEGRYTVVASSGWQVEETVTTMAVELYAEQAEEARRRVWEGLAAPLEYHMFRRRLDIPTLAREVGMMRWRVSRHLKPNNFAGLGNRMLARYAEVLGIRIDELKKVPDA
ncbi:hypothetical protein [Thiohalomonas denitrificans]|uniref:hypothetical protein n=1 Tax=Thiohalomonas denitrificans TaxID=415747 RepID=UPI0026ECF04F|nr:hypothetical protein [Thiohalomonas denitrificans]